MFLGRYEHAIDEKGRITIPVRFREELGDAAYVTQGFDHNLMVLPASSFDKLYANFDQMSMTDPVARQLRRYLLSNAAQVEFDRAGRMLLPPYLRTQANLDSGAVLVGVGEYFEIWSPEHWAKQNELLQDTEVITQRFSALNLPIR